MGAYCVMVVEDTQELRESLCELLEDEGYLTIAAVNGQDAFERLRACERLPDLILLDLMMPIMDGWEFSQQQGLDALLASIPVVAMTAGGRGLRQETSWRSVISKPMSVEYLLRTVRAHFVR